MSALPAFCAAGLYRVPAGGHQHPLSSPFLLHSQQEEEVSVYPRSQTRAQLPVAYSTVKREPYCKRREAGREPENKAYYQCIHVILV